MKTYKLLKDLPTFKAGDIFELRDDGNLWLHTRYGDENHHQLGVMAYRRETLKKFPKVLSEWFEEMPEEKAQGGWIPEKGELYYWLDNCAGVYSTYYRNTSVDALRNAIGNCFKTEEEAVKTAKWLAARKILLDDTAGFKPEVGKWHYRVFWSSNGLSTYDDYDVDGASLISFPTEKAARASIEKHEKEWRTYLGLEEDE